MALGSRGVEITGSLSRTGDRGEGPSGAGQQPHTGGADRCQAWDLRRMSRHCHVLPRPSTPAAEPGADALSPGSQVLRCPGEAARCGSRARWSPGTPSLPRWGAVVRSLRTSSLGGSAVTGKAVACPAYLSVWDLDQVSRTSLRLSVPGGTMGRLRLSSRGYAEASVRLTPLAACPVAGWLFGLLFYPPRGRVPFQVPLVSSSAGGGAQHGRWPQKTTPRPSPH